MFASKSTKKKRPMSMFGKWKSHAEPETQTVVSPPTPSPPPRSVHSALDYDRRQSRYYADSVHSSRSNAASERYASSPRPTISSSVSSSALDPVFEDAYSESPDGLPSYNSVTTPSSTVRYSFSRDGPFSMQLLSDSASSQPIYHVSVGVNVWMPTSFVTCIRRGGENGRMIGQVEMGITTKSASITIGHETKPLSDIVFKKSMMSTTRHYMSPDGLEIKWKVDAMTWHAFIGSRVIASFTPPRVLNVQPEGHRHLDHLMISLVVLMRQHLTPRDLGEASNLFNYHQQMHTTYNQQMHV